MKKLAARWGVVCVVTAVLPLDARWYPRGSNGKHTYKRARDIPYTRTLQNTFTAVGHHHDKRAPPPNAEFRSRR